MSVEAARQSMTLDQNLLLEQGGTLAMAGANPAANQGTTGGLLVNAGLAGQSGLFAPSTIGMTYLTIKQQILLLQAEQKRFGEFLKPAHPAMDALGQQIDQYQLMLGIYRDQSVEQLEAKKSALALQMTNVQAQIKQWGQQNLELSRKSAQYQRLKARSDRVQSLYDSLLATLETLDVNKDISPESVTIYQPACEAFPDKTLLSKGLAIAGVLGLILGVVVLMLLERVDDRMNSFTELQELFDEDVLGQIPRERKDIRGGLLPFVQPDDKRHPFVESYRNLRSSLLYMAAMGKGPHTLLVTSAVPNDGKSLTADVVLPEKLGGWFYWGHPGHGRRAGVAGGRRPAQGHLAQPVKHPERHRAVGGAFPKHRLASGGQGHQRPQFAFAPPRRDHAACQRTFHRAGHGKNPAGDEQGIRLRVD